MGVFPFILPCRLSSYMSGMGFAALVLALLCGFVAATPLPDKIDTEEEDRGLIALSILVGKLQDALNSALGISTTPRPRPILDAIAGLFGGDTTTTCGGILGGGLIGCDETTTTTTVAPTTTTTKCGGLLGGGLLGCPSDETTTTTTVTPTTTKCGGLLGGGLLC